MAQSIALGMKSHHDASEKEMSAFHESSVTRSYPLKSVLTRWAGNDNRNKTEDHSKNTHAEGVEGSFLIRPHIVQFDDPTFCGYRKNKTL